MKDELLLISTGSLVLASIITVGRQILLHLRNYTEPSLQLYITRILLMIPVYASVSWLSIYRPEHTLIYSSIKDCYEAYILYLFICLMTQYLGGEDKLIVHLEAHTKPLYHPWPLHNRRLNLGRRFFVAVKKSVLQFVILKPLTALAALLLDKWGIYTEGSLKWTSGYLYIAFINNVSITIALYGLVYFYLGTQEWLTPFKPLAKFLCIKGVLFFSYWQYCFFTWLVNLGVFGSDLEKAQHFSLTVQNALICVEILAAAVAMSLAFSADEFIEFGKRNRQRHYISNIAKVLSVNDVIADARQTFGQKENVAESESLLKKVKSEEQKIWEEAFTNINGNFSP